MHNPTAYLLAKWEFRDAQDRYERVQTPENERRLRRAEAEWDRAEVALGLVTPQSEPPRLAVNQNAAT